MYPDPDIKFFNFLNVNKLTENIFRTFHFLFIFKTHFFKINDYGTVPYLYPPITNPSSFCLVRHYEPHTTEPEPFVITNAGSAHPDPAPDIIMEPKPGLMLSYETKSLFVKMQSNDPTSEWYFPAVLRIRIRIRIRIHRIHMFLVLPDPDPALDPDPDPSIIMQKL